MNQILAIYSLYWRCIQGKQVSNSLENIETRKKKIRIWPSGGGDDSQLLAYTWGRNFSLQAIALSTESDARVYNLTFPSLHQLRILPVHCKQYGLNITALTHS